MTKTILVTTISTTRYNIDNKNSLFQALGQWGLSKMRPVDVRRAGSGRKREKVAPSAFFYHTPLVPCPLFGSSPLTESPEQATTKTVVAKTTTICISLHRFSKSPVKIMEVSLEAPLINLGAFWANNE